MTVTRSNFFKSVAKEQNKLMNAYLATLMRIVILSSQLDLQSPAPTLPLVSASVLAPTADNQLSIKRSSARIPVV